VVSACAGSSWLDPRFECPSPRWAAGSGELRFHPGRGGEQGFISEALADELNAER